MLKKLESNPLSFKELQHMMGDKESKKINWLIYDELQNFKSLEEVLKGGACIILLQIEGPRAPPVGHFIALLDHGTHIEHFDSYGLSIDEENNVTHERHLSNLFKESKRPIVENHKRLQTFREDIQTCGRWTVARVLLRHLELKNFLQLISSIATPNDITVTLMTMLLPFKN